MTFTPTLTFYVARGFLGATLVMLAALTGLVALFDFIELLRRAASRPDVGFDIPATIAALRLPFVSLQILPFAVLLGGIVAFWRLTRSSELIVARAAGVSAWGFLTGPASVAVLLGILATTAISPLSSMMLARAERMDQTFLRTGGGMTALAGGRLWLRQGDREIEPNGVAIVTGRPAMARPTDPRDGLRRFELQGVTVWRLSEGDRALARIEAPRAWLEGGRWVIEDAVTFGADRQPAAPTRIELPTELTPSRIEESFASPETLGFWSLPGFIAVLEEAGFSAVRHRIQFQSLLSLPVLALAMALLAAGFSMRHNRRGGVAQMLAGGVAAGFALFVVDRVSNEFGEAGSLPVLLAAWAPTVAGLLLALALLLHLEDG
ncbi:LPS export ABC transporter permease LptG [Falsiroseomonas oryziterrae]|uniref:LPS export ABC transporter permease LptG n=1 Tax=Falsiroseomonas oryziterrae TaxID=2911368 RepID=UPI001F0250A8|nr:LPS export ABC transporter permease LptG [Roseomonas sp. NPKOSM-4]